MEKESPRPNPSENALRPTTAHDDVDIDFDRAVATAASSIEARIDAITDDALEQAVAERGELLSVEEVEKIGDAGLEAAEVEEPFSSEEAETSSEDKSERSKQIHSIFEKNVLDLRLDTAEGLDRISSGLKKIEAEVAGAEEAIIKNLLTAFQTMRSAPDTFQRMPGAALNDLRAGAEMFATVIKRVEQLMGDTTGDADAEIRELSMLIREQTKQAELHDTNFQVVAAEEGIEVEEGTIRAKDAIEPVNGVTANIQGLKDQLDEFEFATVDRVTGGSYASRRAEGTLYQKVDMLGPIVEQSIRTQSIDMNVLAPVLLSIQNELAENGRLRQSIKNLGVSLKLVVEDIENSRKKLLP